MSMLEVRGLAVGYGKVAVLRDARLDVGSGRIVTVIGPNGAGKTTLLAALMGLLPARGSVRYDGENLADLSVEARVRRGMCLVPERRELFGDMPVEDNLRLGAFSRLAARPRGQRTIWRRSTHASRACRSAARSSRTRCPAASGRCWRSAVP